MASEDQHADCDKTGGIGIEPCNPLNRQVSGFGDTGQTPPSFSFIVMFIISCICVINNTICQILTNQLHPPALSGQPSNFQPLQFQPDGLRTWRNHFVTWNLDNVIIYVKSDMDGQLCWTSQS